MLEFVSVDMTKTALKDFDHEVLEILLHDHTTGRNIMWCTDDYSKYGEGFSSSDEITIEKITGQFKELIRPRALKSKEEQRDRTRGKAEVFTPSWICNSQNNLIDNAWFECEGVFNTEHEDHSWTTNLDKVSFPLDKSWKDYVREVRLEITCGEAPYLVSRYDTTNGELIPVANRIGLLDRKLRVINENVDDYEEWLKWVQIAYQNIYGYEWQGDNLLLARETLLQTFFDYHTSKFGEERLLQNESVRCIAYIISWNLWQMDGIKGVVPNSCAKRRIETVSLFGDIDVTIQKCRGCTTGNIREHNGIYALIMDWSANKDRQVIRFIDLLK